MNELNSVFNFSDYKPFLKHSITRLPKKGRGFRSELARALACQTAYVSQVLNGDAHFNLEQALIVNRLLGHNEAEARFFILLVEQARAGTRDLREFFQRQINEAKVKHSVIRERFKTQRELSLEDQIQYYSEWFIAALHIMTSIPRYQGAQAISEALGLPMHAVLRSLEFLSRCGLIRHEGGQYSIGEIRLHLGNDSSLTSKHHVNWRLQAMRSLERLSDQELHYTSVVSLSPEDGEKIRALLVEAMDRYNKIVATSPEVECHCLTFDFFRVAPAYL